ncbi:MAG: glycerol-3-phosphate 1-O-acyltransferase PlsY [Rhodanobacteraceae bacterium]|nr:glycerol-3-phosphate 1-O-acyltransferase PlsY [Rhodanobacteraceae bacterium]
MILLAKLIASYLIGSIVGSLLLGKLNGVDIRNQGSGNAGATNALRTQGKAFALGTALIDFGKGVFAAAVIAPIGWSAGGGLSLIETQLACGLAAALGHCYPLFHGFRGGKGAGTLFGMLAWLFPWVALAMLGLWLLVLTTTGYVGLGTVIAGIAFPIALYLMQGWPGAILMGLAVGAALLLIFTHRSNLARLRAGTEHRFERARVLARVVGKKA